MRERQLRDIEERVKSIEVESPTVPPTPPPPSVLSSPRNRKNNVELDSTQRTESTFHGGVREKKNRKKERLRAPVASWLVRE